MTTRLANRELVVDLRRATEAGAVVRGARVGAPAQNTKTQNARGARGPKTQKHKTQGVPESKKHKTQNTPKHQ